MLTGKRQIRRAYSRFSAIVQPKVVNAVRYDAETDFYYLQSRYYDPETGRFLNADNAISGSGESVQGYNLFTYCDNNPINKSDSTGNWPRWITATVAAIATTVAVVATVVSAPAVATIATTVGIVAGVTLMIQTLHYDVRQSKNTVPPNATPKSLNDAGWKNSNKKSKSNPNGGGPAADCHQYTSPDKTNVKYVSPDGHNEQIFDISGIPVLDSRDIGTYNIIPYKGDFWSFIGHGLLDVVPWAILGNNDDDPGPAVNWIIQIFE